MKRGNLLKNSRSLVCKDASSISRLLSNLEFGALASKHLEFSKSNGNLPTFYPDVHQKTGSWIQIDMNLSRKCLHSFCISPAGNALAPPALPIQPHKSCSSLKLWICDPKVRCCQHFVFVGTNWSLKCRDDGDATQAGIAIWKDTFEKATLKTSKDGIQALVRENISMFRNDFGMLRLV